MVGHCLGMIGESASARQGRCIHRVTAGVAGKQKAGQLAFLVEHNGRVEENQSANYLGEQWCGKQADGAAHGVSGKDDPFKTERRNDGNKIGDQITVIPSIGWVSR
jgi:hypothetical protein